MVKLEELTKDASVKGIIPNDTITVIDVKWHGSSVVEITYKDSSGKLANELVYPDSENSIEIATAGKHWSFDADGDKFRLVSEALCIKMAYLFDHIWQINESQEHDFSNRSNRSCNSSDSNSIRCTTTNISIRTPPQSRQQH